MRVAAHALLGVLLFSDAQVQAASGASFDIQVNLADQRVVQLALTVPDGTQHLLQVDGDLSVDLQVRWVRGRQVIAKLVNTAGGTTHNLANIYEDTKPDGETLRFSFSVCGDRFIALKDSMPGSCSELPEMAKPDRIFPSTCSWCVGPYEGMPSIITAHERIAPQIETGEPLTLTGRVLGVDGKPRAGIIVYAYHTDASGIYPPPIHARSSVSDYHGRLRGWVRSDAQGRYTFDTILPGSYPKSDNPRHIHMHVIEPGCSTYAIEELHFANDPLFQQMSADDRKLELTGEAGSGVVTPRRKGKGWVVTRDIYLGKNVEGYEMCQVSK